MSKTKKKVKKITHQDLIESAARWLRSFNAVVITEMSGSGGWNSGEIPDAIGWDDGSITTLVECKASRSDFLTDRKKPHRSGIGMGTRRYYFTPEGVAHGWEVPPGWGLLEYKNKVWHPKIVKHPLQQQFKNWPHEASILCSALRRIGGLRKEGVSVKVYQWPTKNTATLGVKKGLALKINQEEEK